MIDKNIANRPNFWIMILLGAGSFYGVSHCMLDWGCLTAFVWPAYETFPWFERLLDPEFAVNDFWLNAFMEPQLKHHFAYIILAVQKLAGFNHYYDSFFLFKLILSTCYVPIVYAALISLIPIQLERSLTYWVGHIAVAIMCLISGSPKVWELVAVAYWQPLRFDVVPSTFAQMIGFLAIFLNSFEKSKPWSYLLFLITVTIHAAIGCFIVIFNYICRAHQIKNLWKEAGAVFIFCCIVPGFLLSKMNYAGTLSPELTYEIIAKNYAPFHWKLSDLGTYIPGEPWQDIAKRLVIIMLTIGGLSIAFLKKGLPLTMISLAGAICYVGSFIFHYVFTEYFVSNTAIYFASIRFNIFGYWIITLCGATLFAMTIDFILRFIPLTLNFPGPIEKIYRTISYSPKKLSPILLLIIGNIGLMAGIRTHYQDNPIAAVKHPQVVEWAKKTPKDSVFLTSGGGLKEDIILRARRSTYLFLNPFNEKAQYEWYQRHKVIWGTYDDWMQHPGAYVLEKKWKNYINMTPERLVKAATKDKIDFFLILPSGLNQLNEKFSKLTPTKKFVDQTLMWSAKDLQEQVCSLESHDFCNESLATTTKINKPSISSEDSTTSSSLSFHK